MDFKKIWQRRRELTEKCLEEELERGVSLDETLKKSMEYSLMAGGKRLRPVLLMAAADAVGGNGENFLLSAAALEMIHTYSLIHDDLPAMDNDDFRRGKPTNHKVYGEAAAILAGDALLTLAFETLTHENTTPEKIVAVTKEIAHAAGMAGMVGGQVLDIGAENENISLQELKKLHGGKTGALFRASVISGAILADAGENEIAALGAVGFSNYRRYFGRYGVGTCYRQARGERREEP